MPQILCTTPLTVLDWLALVGGVGFSSALLLKNTFPLVQEKAPTLSRTIGIAVGGMQALFGLILKLYFFRRISF